MEEKPKKKNTKSKMVESDSEDNKSNGYIKPSVTYTEKLSKKEIGEMLTDYEKVVDLKTIELGSHVRYFEDVSGEMKFRMGGNVIVKTGLPEYVVLTNGKTKWSVQVKRCVFFKKISIAKIREEYTAKILEKDQHIDTLMAHIKNLKKEIKNLKKEIKR